SWYASLVHDVTSTPLARGDGHDVGGREPDLLPRRHRGEGLVGETIRQRDRGHLGPAPAAEIVLGAGVREADERSTAVAPGAQKVPDERATVEDDRGRRCPEVERCTADEIRDRRGRGKRERYGVRVGSGAVCRTRAGDDADARLVRGGHDELSPDEPIGAVEKDLRGEERCEA